MLKNTSVTSIPSTNSQKSAGARFAADLGRFVGAIESTPPVLFAHEFLTHPSTVGAIWPSSAQLAQRMASAVPVTGTGIVVDLGAGTGVVTQALLDRGIHPTRLRVDAIVSSLPLRSLKQNDVAAIFDEWRTLLRPGALLVQFTYALHGRHLYQPVVPGHCVWG